MKLYTIYDSKAEVHSSPFPALNADLAKRDLTKVPPEHDYNVFAEDYTLFEVGTYDDHTATIFPYDAIRSICNFVTIMPKRSERDAHNQLDIEQ